MGGHGGLNILPQKRWNVYNYENREKVRKDEEAAAKEEQLKREQARKRDAELRIEQLRASHGLAPSESRNQKEEPVETDKNPGHINLFEGIKIFDPVKKFEGRDCEERDGFKRKKLKKEEPPRVVTAEDEKYRLGYGVAGRGVKLPWYLQRKGGEADDGNDDDRGSSKEMKERERKNGKKTLEELREERLKREKKDKERVQKLLQEHSRRDGGFSRR